MEEAGEVEAETGEWNEMAKEEWDVMSDKDKAEYATEKEVSSHAAKVAERSIFGGVSLTANKDPMEEVESLKERLHKVKQSLGPSVKMCAMSKGKDVEDISAAYEAG